MMKICVISGTHREGSYTYRVSAFVHRCLKEQDGSIRAEIFSLGDLPRDFIFESFYAAKQDLLEHQVNEKIRPMNALICVIPEYNGSFPGIVKAWIDCLHPSVFYDKPVLLVGVSSGRAGNLRGMEHLTGIFQHLKMHVYHHKIPLSRIEEIWKNGEPDPEIKEVMIRVIGGFLDFVRLWQGPRTIR